MSTCGDAFQTKISSAEIPPESDVWPSKVTELPQCRRIGVWRFDFGLEFGLCSSGRGCLCLLLLLLLLCCLLLCLPLALLLSQLSVAFLALPRQLRVGRGFEFQIGSCA
jgi:hypothetical protein